MPCILDSMDTLSGSVERITFYNLENGYTVLRLRPEHQTGINAAPKSSLSFDGLATVVGNLPEVSPGEHLRLQGQWNKHPKHGSQFKQKSANKPCQPPLRESKVISAPA